MTTTVLAISFFVFLFRSLFAFFLSFFIIIFFFSRLHQLFFVWCVYCISHNFPGTFEAPLNQENSDPVTDLLVTERRRETEKKLCINGGEKERKREKREERREREKRERERREREEREDR